MHLFPNKHILVYISIQYTHISSLTEFTVNLTAIALWEIIQNNKGGKKEGKKVRFKWNFKMQKNPTVLKHKTVARV